MGEFSKQRRYVAYTFLKLAIYNISKFTHKKNNNKYMKSLNAKTNISPFQSF